MENDTLDLIRPEKWHYFKDFACWNSLLNKNYLPNEIMKYVYSYVLNDVKNMANNDIIKYKVLFHSLYNSKYFSNSSKYYMPDWFYIFDIDLLYKSETRMIKYRNMIEVLFEKNDDIYRYTYTTRHPDGMAFMKIRSIK